MFSVFFAWFWILVPDWKFGNLEIRFDVLVLFYDILKKFLKMFILDMQILLRRDLYPSKRDRYKNNFQNFVSQIKISSF